MIKWTFGVAYHHKSLFCKHIFFIHIFFLLCLCSCFADIFYHYSYIWFNLSKMTYTDQIHKFLEFFSSIYSGSYLILSAFDIKLQTYIPPLILYFLTCTTFKYRKCLKNNSHSRHLHMKYTMPFTFPIIEIVVYN